MDFGNFGGSSSGYLCHGQFGEFLAVLGKEGEEVIFGLSAEFVGFDHFCIGGYREKETVVSDKREMILYVSRKMTEATIHWATVSGSCPYMRVIRGDDER